MSITAEQIAKATQIIQAGTDNQVYDWAAQYENNLSTATDPAKIEQLTVVSKIAGDESMKRASARVAAEDARIAARTEAPVMSTTRQDCRYCGQEMHRDGGHMVCDECGADTVGSYL